MLEAVREQLLPRLSLITPNGPELEALTGLPVSSPELVRLAARYLASAKQGGGELGAPFDPVSRFHLGNGARVERLNYLGDTSAKGFRQSFGLMVNYLYDPDDIERNLEAFASDGTIAASAAIRRQARSKA